MSKLNNSSIRIFSLHHKKYWYSENSIIKPLQIGKALSTLNLGFAHDNTGNNISYKNNLLCELTGMYWAWKNTKFDYIGFCHYRRYFSFKHPCLLNLKLKLSSKISANTYQIKCTDLKSIKNLGILDTELINNFVPNYDIILPFKSHFRNLRRGFQKETIAKQYGIAHCKEDLDLLITSIINLYPNLANEVDYFFNHNNGIYLFTMFIMRFELFDQYMNFLFNILNVLENKINLKNRNSYQTRALAFMGERLLNIFLIKIQKERLIKIKELPVIFIQDH